MIYRKLLTKIHKFPCSQMNKSTCMYNSDQIYPIVFGPNPMYYYSSSITALCDFPRINWQCEFSVKRPHNILISLLHISD